MTPFSAQGESTAPLKSEGTAKDGAIALIPSVHGNIGMGILGWEHWDGNIDEARNYG